MATWHLAPSLAVLRGEINARWPGRDRTSDGSIGDTAHSARSSDHNPNSRGSVNAIDIDEDGVDMAAIKAAIQRHPSAHYWIYERRIADRDNGWRPVPYYGDNPHDKHLHVSIRQTTSAEQDRRPWGLIEEDDVDDATIAKIAAAVVRQKMGASGPTVEQALQPAPARLSRIEATLAQIAGKDWVNEIVDGVLAGLGGKDLDDAVAALVAAFGDRSAELAAKLAAATAQGSGGGE